MNVDVDKKEEPAKPAGTEAAIYTTRNGKKRGGERTGSSSSLVKIIEAKGEGTLRDLRLCRS